MSSPCGLIGTCHLFHVSGAADLASIAAPALNDRALCGDPPTLTWRYDGAVWVLEDATAYAWIWAGFEELGGAGAAAWGAITGTLADQVDLQNALDTLQSFYDALVLSLVDALALKQDLALLSQADGYASLDGSAKIPVIEIPTGTSPFTVAIGNDARLSDARVPTAHKTSHQDGGTDELSVTGLSGVLADPQPPIIGAGAAQAVAGNDARLTDSRTPSSTLAHATSHKSGGTDAIKLDELAAPTDIATLNATAVQHGLLPKLSGVAGEFLNGVGAFATPVAAAGDTSKVLAAGTSTILADTCRYIVGRFEVVSGAHLAIDAAGSLEVG